MPISFQRYIDIQSSVGGVPAVTTRELIARIFTDNSLLPTQSQIEFTSVTDVGSYFGTASEEYLRAVFYLGWVSKNRTRPRKISYARWVDVATAPSIFGVAAVYAFEQFTGITAGSFTLTLGGVTQLVSSINLSSAANLAQVASILQTAIRAAHSGTMWTTAQVNYDTTRGAFNFIGGTTGGPANIVIVDGAQNVAATYGWLAGAILSNGSAVETITQTLTNSAQASNNFGSFAFTYGLALTQAEVVEAATWNAGQNVLYQYHVAASPTVAPTLATLSAALLAIPGWGGTVQGMTGEYHEMDPMAVLAATAYGQPNSTQNFMFQQFDQTPTVTDDATADAMDALRMNYYGVTQTAGNTLAFYQRGVLGGGASDLVDMNVYGNEQWLKDAIGASVMSMILRVGRVSAGPSGRAKLIGATMPVIDNNEPGGVGAVQNGTITPGKALTADQIATIGEDSGDPNAWRQVQTIGYWLDYTFSTYQTSDGRTETAANYMLIYSKDDQVRKVNGTDILI